jgi:hypothetical protein
MGYVLSSQERTHIGGNENIGVCEDVFITVTYCAIIVIC